VLPRGLDNQRTQGILRIVRNAGKTYGIGPEISQAARWWTCFWQGRADVSSRRNRATSVQAARRHRGEVAARRRWWTRAPASGGA